MLSESLGMAAMPAERRMSWAFAMREAGFDFDFGFGFGSGFDSGSVLGLGSDSDSDSGAGSADNCEDHDCCGHATGFVDWRPDAVPGLGLGLGPGSCGSWCRLVREAQRRRRLDCVAMVCLLRLMIDRAACASAA